MKVKPFHIEKIQRFKEKANSHEDFAKVLIPMKGNFETTHFGKVQLPLSLPFCATFTIYIISNNTQYYHHGWQRQLKTELLHWR
jgi:hypothetical protein